MSELSIFKGGNLVVPDYLKSKDAATDALAGDGKVFRRISIEGGVWRMVVGGKEVGKNVDRHLDVVILAAAPNNTRTFYEGTYQKGVKTPPTCMSDDGVKPNAKSTKPQSAHCASCPQNVAGSGQGESRACRFSRRIAVVLANNIEGDIFGMSVPAASLFGNDVNKKSLQQYARMLSAHDMGMNAVVTRLQFDTDASTPKIMFDAMRPLDQAEYNVITERRGSEDALAAVNTPVHEQDGVASPAPNTESRVHGTVAPTTAKAADEPTVRTGAKGAKSVVDADAALSSWANEE